MKVYELQNGVINFILIPKYINYIMQITFS